MNGLDWLSSNLVQFVALGIAIWALLDCRRYAKSERARERSVDPQKDVRVQKLIVGSIPSFRDVRATLKRVDSCVECGDGIAGGSDEDDQEPEDGGGSF